MEDGTPLRASVEEAEGWPFVPPPEDRLVPIYRVIWPRAGERLTGVVLAERTRGVLIHYHAGRTFLCKRAWLPCDGCAHAASARWQGYLPILLLPGRQRRVLLLTQGGYLNCQALRTGDGRLRGASITAWREPSASNRPVAYTLKRLPPDENLPLPHDIGATLCALWQIAEDSDIGRAILAGGRADTPRLASTGGSTAAATPAWTPQARADGEGGNG